MGFSKKEYEAKYEEMFSLLKTQISLFTEIIEDERQRILTAENNKTE